MSLTKGQEAYNARWLTASQVAATFVAPAQFRQLTNNCHSILVGPRGSGKTTLLKMLQQSALERWIAPEAEEFRQRVNFTGVFIPADISWGEQLASLGGNSITEEHRVLLSNAAFSTHILRALIETMLFRINPLYADISTPFRRVLFTKEKEKELIQTISPMLFIKPPIPTLLSLKHTLAARMGEIYSISKTLQYKKDKTDFSPQTYLDHSFLYLDPLTTTGACVEAFNDISGEQEAIWALMFDELEIAPDLIQQQLIEATRSTNPLLRYKLALSPYNIHGITVGGRSAPSPDNDYDQIQLWYAHRDQKAFSKSKRAFCNHLWNSMLRLKDVAPASPEISLGGIYSEEAPSSLIVSSKPINNRKTSPYSANGRWGKRFQSLYDKDPSFRKYLDIRNISPISMDQLSVQIRDSVVRKIAPIVMVREFYRGATTLDGNQLETVSSRSRKGVEIYTGAEFLFEISEGHPRWFKVTVGRMLDQFELSHKKTIPRSLQGQEIIAWAHRFSALLKTYPATTTNRTKRSGTLLWVIEKIANYFHKQVVTGPFNPEPYLSFIVDSNIDNELLLSLESALDLGAIVYIPDDTGQVLLTSLRGKRFRICYWLAPLYGLPLTPGRPVALSTILKSDNELSSITPQLPFLE